MFSQNPEKNLRSQFKNTFFLLGILPIIIMLIAGTFFSYFELKNESFIKLNIARDTTKKNILTQFSKMIGESYFFQSTQNTAFLAGFFLRSDIQFLAKTSLVIGNKTGRTASESEKNILWLNDFRLKNNYSDVYFIDNSGMIRFSFINPDLIGLNVGTAGTDYSFLKTVMIKTHQKKSIYVSDMFYFKASNNEILFIGIPVITPDNSVSGIFVFSYPGQAFSHLASAHTSFGKTLETYIVGEDTYFRTNSKFFSGAPLKLKADTESVRKGLNHLTGIHYNLDYRDTMTLSSYTFMGLDESLHLDYDWVLISEIDFTEAFSDLFSLVTIMACLTILLILVNIYLSNRISEEISSPIAELADMSEEIASGNFNVNFSHNANFTEFTQLKNSFNSMIQTFQKISISMQSLSQGNTKIDLNNDDDNSIIQSMNKMIETFNDYSLLAQEVAKGNFNVSFNPRSEHDRLGNSLLQMTENLMKNQESIYHNDWLRNGRTGISEIAHDTSNLDQMTYAFLTFFSDYFNAHAGLFYIADPDKTIPELRLSATSGIPEKYRPRVIIQIDDGILGNFLHNKTGIRILDSIDENYFCYGSGFGLSRAGQILIASFSLGSKTLAVMELLFTKKIQPEVEELIRETQNTIATSISIAFENQKTKLLLQKTISQADELQAQQEELRIVNEEMTEKNKTLEKQKEYILEKNLSLERITKELEKNAKELSAANHYKSEFLANMSHELRTPLNSLLLLSGKLEKNKDGNLNERQIKSLKIIHQSGNSLLMLINGILDLAKIEAGKMEVNLSEASLQGIIREMESNFQESFNEKNIKLEFKLYPDAPAYIVTDAQKLIQILRNLIANALKFTQKGGVSVSFEKTGKNEKDHLLIRVKDTGIGIPEDKMHLIFQAFQQVDGSISRNYGGTGLGLTIVKEMMRQLSGFVEAESRINEGSEFRIYHPLNLRSGTDSVIAKRQTETLYESRPARIENSHQVNPPVREKHILIIEDETEYAQMLMNLCKTKSFRCTCASDGEMGLHIAETQAVDAVILDLDLPGMSGEDVLQKLKSNPATKYIPVQIISGYDRAEKLLKKGAVGYLKKPASEERILESLDIIQRIISQSLSHVLIFESNQDLKKIIQTLFDQDLSADYASNSREALELMGHNQYGCIILDIDQKNLDTFDFLNKIKQLNGNSCPMIIYTEKELSESEHVRLNEFASSIIIKRGRSLERLHAESLLFLEKVKTESAEIVNHQQTSDKKDHALAGKTALIIDDDMRNLFALAEELEEEKMAVSKASSGKQAFSLLENPEMHFDIIISDIMMPDLDGYEVMRKIKKMDGHKNTPIIALTAKAMKEDRELCMEAGASDYLVKPIDRENLLNSIKSWIEKGKSHGNTGNINC